MPHTKCKDVYYFAELSDRAKEQAREWFRSVVLNYDNWWDGVYEDAAQIAELMGLDLRQRTVKTIGGGTRREPDIYFSGFYSQGDGACFEGAWRAAAVQPGGVRTYAGQDTELHRIAGVFEGIAEQFPGAAFSCQHAGRYWHEFCTDFDATLGVDPLDEVECGSVERTERDEPLGRVEEELIENARDFMRWIYRSLEKEHDWILSDEQVDAAITENGYEFTEDGRNA